MSRKIENLYNRFKVMLIKRDEASKNRVTAILKSIDEELAKKKTRFLTGNLCYQVILREWSGFPPNLVENTYSI